MSSTGTTNLDVAGIPENPSDETHRDHHHQPPPTEALETKRLAEEPTTGTNGAVAAVAREDSRASSVEQDYDYDPDAWNSSGSESNDNENCSETTTAAMFKRLRLHRTSEGEHDVERNEHGLVMRVRRSFKKNRAPTQALGPRAVPMFATVCINNVNRSMQAHVVLRDAGLRVTSFGAGVQVCFPGRQPDTPRLFGFGTPYETMHKALLAEDEPLYRQNGVLTMLERNMQVKQKPQQFQLLLNKQLEDLDVVVCLDYAMFIRVLNDLRTRIRFCFQKKRLHVICLDVEDTPQDALSGGELTLELCQEINALVELNDADVKKIVVAFEKRHQLEMFYVGLSV